MKITRVVCVCLGTKKPVFRAGHRTATRTTTRKHHDRRPSYSTKLAIAAILATKRTRQTTTGRQAAVATVYRVYTNNDNNIKRIIAHKYYIYKIHTHSSILRDVVLRGNGRRYSQQRRARGKTTAAVVERCICVFFPQK